MFLTGIIPLGDGKIITAKADNGEIYVAIKPISEELGIEWSRQFQKLKKDERYGHMYIPLKLSEGGLHDMLCIPHKKVLTWLFSINPNKIKPELRSKLIAFQDETEWAIYEYWTKGEVKKSDFVGSEAFMKLHDSVLKLSEEKSELSQQLCIAKAREEANERYQMFNDLMLHQEKLKLLAKMKEYATEFYNVTKEIGSVPFGYGTYSVRQKLDGFARKMWSQYSAFKDEIELFENELG